MAAVKWKKSEQQMNTIYLNDEDDLITKNRESENRSGTCQSQ
jgi:hypothetical protein